MRLTRLLAAASLILLAGGIALAQEKVDNPEFANWSKFKKGTSVTLKSTSDVAGMTTESTITTTLVDVGTDKLVVEMSTATKANGMEFKTPPIKRDVLKTIPLPEGVKKEEFAKGKVPGTLEEGTETLKVAGKEYKTKWYKTKTSAGGMNIEGKIWMTEEVPGMVVKMESSTKGAVAFKTTLEVTEFKKP